MKKLNNAQEAIEQAGYHPSRAKNIEEVLTDPFFWQELGKARGWKPRAREQVADMPSYEWDYQAAKSMYSWEYYAHQWFETRLNNGEEDKFFQQLP